MILNGYGFSLIIFARPPPGLDRLGLQCLKMKDWDRIMKLREFILAKMEPLLRIWCSTPLGRSGNRATV